MAVASDAALLRAPFPYFGGKSRIAAEVWRRFGDVPNYVEPFFGSGAVLLARPHELTTQLETVNDINGYIANFWRAVQHDPDGVAYYADWPVNENDLHARHYWLLQHKESLRERLEGDPDWYDTKIAGWWVWGASAWIAGGWCAGDGPWVSIDGKLVKMERRRVKGDSAPTLMQGVPRKSPDLSRRGRGVHALSTAMREGEEEEEHEGIHRPTYGIYERMRALSKRLRRVRVACGDFERVVRYSATCWLGVTGVFLDPPYSPDLRAKGLYICDDVSAARRAREWAVSHGDNPALRIALCGYTGEHDMPEGWTCYRWKANGGYGNRGNGRGRANASRECIWFSPHCLKPEDGNGRLL